MEEGREYIRIKHFINIQASGEQVILFCLFEHFWNNSNFLEFKVEILEYISKSFIVHNDIKPANIFLRGAEVFISGTRFLMH